MAQYIYINLQSELYVYFFIMKRTSALSNNCLMNLQGATNISDKCLAKSKKYGGPIIYLKAVFMLSHSSSFVCRVRWRAKEGVAWEIQKDI